MSISYYCLGILVIKKTLFNCALKISHFFNMYEFLLVFSLSNQKGSHVQLSKNKHSLYAV